MNELAANEFMDIPQDDVWAASITFLVEVCASLGDSDRADVLYRLLSPYAGFAVVAEVACFGAASRYPGATCRNDGPVAGGRVAFRSGIGHECREWERSRGWPARNIHYAQMLLARCAPGDSERARMLLEDASTIARQLGMRSLETRISDLKPAKATNGSPREVDIDFA